MAFRSSGRLFEVCRLPLPSLAIYQRGFVKKMLLLFTLTLVDVSVLVGLDLAVCHGGTLLKTKDGYIHSEITFFYRDYVFLVLCRYDGNRDEEVLDIVFHHRENDMTYFASGPVEINDSYFDWDVVVLIVGPYDGQINKNIAYAYKSNTENVTIESHKFEKVVIYAEGG